MGSRMVIIPNIRVRLLGGTQKNAISGINVSKKVSSGKTDKRNDNIFFMMHCSVSFVCYAVIIACLCVFHNSLSEKKEICYNEMRQKHMVIIR